MSGRRESPSELEQLVVVTGMSGSGKHTAFKALEDLGFFCVDNLPTPLLPRLIQLSKLSGGRIRKLAVVVDVRQREGMAGLRKFFEQYKGAPFHCVLIFVDASDEALLRRYSETRRFHPLAHDRSLLEGIQQERRELAPLRALADLVIDTSRFSVHDLRHFIYERFQKAEELESPVLSVVSFGFKFGLPYNADLVFDVRFLPNPHFVPELRELSGEDPPVVEFLRAVPDTEIMLGKMEDMLEYLLPKYEQEGKAYLTVAIGCTGGRHRSVMMAAELSRRLRAKGYSLNLVHRDIHHQ